MHNRKPEKDAKPLNVSASNIEIAYREPSAFKKFLSMFSCFSNSTNTNYHRIDVKDAQFETKKNK